MEEVIKNYLLENPKPECDGFNVFLNEETIKENFGILTKKMKVNSTVETTTVSKDTLETSARMYTYLTYCPPKLLSMYRTLFMNSSPKKIILALSSILKTSDGAAKKTTGKIFTKVMEKLGLDQFKSIEMISEKENMYCKECFLKKTNYNETLAILGQVV